jgi:PilZ domain-containing protein
MDERRIGNRHKSFLQGRVYYNNRRASLDCLVRDISPTGARLKFPGPVTAPEFVELYIPNKDEFYQAQVQWNRGDEIGVHFIRDEAESAPAAGGSLPEASLAERMQKLETELAALKRVIKELKAEQRERSGDAA